MCIMIKCGPHWGHLTGGTLLGAPYWGHLTGGTSLGAPHWGHLTGGTSLGAPHWGHLTGGTSPGAPQETKLTSAIQPWSRILCSKWESERCGVAVFVCWSVGTKFCSPGWQVCCTGLRRCFLQEREVSPLQEGKIRPESCGRKTCE